MANTLHPDVLDGGLSELVAFADCIYLVSQDPVDYTAASVTYALGHKTFGVGLVFSSIADAVPNGRMVSSEVVTNGTVTATGTATGWAVLDTVGQRLLANGDLSASQAITIGNTFQLDAITIRIPNQ
jgi:hypothetical protein